MWKCIEGYMAESPLDDLGWWFVMLRASELSETVTFVLRKKYSQISFLHVYHHISTLALSWFFYRMGPCECLK